MVIAVSYHETLTKLQAPSALAAGPFDRPEWFALLARHGSSPCIVVAEDGDAKAALPLMHERGGYVALANWFSFIWRPLVPSGPQGNAMLLAMARKLRGRTPSLVMGPLPDEDGSATRLENALRQAGWMVKREVCDENHILNVGGRSFADYWATRPGALRTTLKRKKARVDVEIIVQFDDDAWQSYLSIYRESWKPGEELADLLQEFARAEATSGRLRLGVARYNGAPVAAQFWTVDGGTAYIHKLAHRESAKALSAGTTLSAAMFAHVIDNDRVSLIDFGTGRDGYKRDWMEEVRPRYRLVALDYRNPRAWPLLARRVVRRLAWWNRAR